MAKREASTPTAAHRNIAFKDFKGVNTQANRQSIGDNEFAWLENVQPIGFGNAAAVPYQSQSLVTFASGDAYLIRSFNLSGTDYLCVITDTGAAYQINIGTYAVTTIGAAATFSTSGASVAQWQNNELLIIDPAKGYFSWNGTTLTKWNGTIQSLTITNIGTGYTSAPTIGGFATGGGSGGAATCDIQVGLATINTAGTGYNVGDTVTISGGTAVTAATLQVTAIGGGGAITGIALLNSGDYTAAPANPALSTSPYGSGAKFDLNFGIGPITLTAAGSGYTSAPTITVTGGGGSSGAVTANLSVVPSTGTFIEVYAGRVWVSTGSSGQIRTIAFSAPNSYNDFTSTAAGGSFIISDQTLHSSITGLRAANNFLYIFGVDSCNIIGDVTVVSGVTTFSNTNISAGIGTNQANSILPYYRAMTFASPTGVFAMYGSTPQKASDALDGIWPLIDQTKPISAGLVSLNNILCAAFLFSYQDPVNGTRPLIALFFNSRWFFASQGSDLTLIASASSSGTPTLFATNGKNLYRLFQDSDTPIVQTLVTKLWDMGDPIVTKEAMKLGVEVTIPTTSLQLAASLQTEYAYSEYTVTFDGGNQVEWVNNSGVVVRWQNDILQTVEWLAAGFAWLTSDVQTAGRYLGATINGISPAQVYSGIHMQYINRAEWTAP